MDKIDILYNEYSELKSEYLTNTSINLKEDLKNKLIELDYQINKDYEININLRFPMTTTIEKEEIRLEGLITYIKRKSEEQKKLIEDYKSLTGLNIELSYLKSSDRLLEYRERLDLVRKFLSIKKDLTKLLNNPKESNNSKIKVLKNKLLKKDMLNLLYEFCLIDSLDIEDIDVNKIVEKEKNVKEITEKPTKIKVVKKNKEKNKKDEEKEEKTIEAPKEVIQEVQQEEKKLKEEIQHEQEEKEDENKILTTMPQLEKLGTVTRVNVFESLKKTEEKLPDVVIPSNGLTEENTEIFIDTKQYFN